MFWSHVASIFSILLQLLLQHPFVFRGRKWTGEYLLDFNDLITSDKPEIVSTTEEARFSFIKVVMWKIVAPKVHNHLVYPSVTLYINTAIIVSQLLVLICSFFPLCHISYCLSPIENEEQLETSLSLAEVTEKALNIQNPNKDAILYQGGAMTSIDYLKARSYRGLKGEYEDPAPDSVLVGRSGRAAGYSQEKTQSEQ
jgi:diphthamide biosynthesis protein 2